MRKFDTNVQLVKYNVLKTVAEKAFKDELLQSIPSMPKELIPGSTATMRCCVYKERAIINERIRIAIAGCKPDANVIEIIDIACEECPVGGFEVTMACRGCIAHRCQEVCPRDAITFDNWQKARIDKSKCVECGKCANVCPYSAIIDHKRPCENACKVKAIKMNDDKVAAIDDSICISCGACVNQCPFGAIQDKSFIIDVIDMIKKSDNNNNFKLYAVVAPSIASQFTYAKSGQVLAGIKALGFYDIVEAALGADMTAFAEAQELSEKGFLTSSCCPAFVDYVEKSFPDLAVHISHNLSPMAMIAKYLKQQDPDAKMVFIGPCTAKKMEFQKETVHPYIDSVITFEELQALFDSRDIDITALEEDDIYTASSYGRHFARSGGLAEAVAQALSEQEDDFDLKPAICDGVEQCRTALLKASKNALPENFIEGMACQGGCIGGAGCLSHGPKNKIIIDNYGKAVADKKISEAPHIAHV